MRVLPELNDVEYRELVALHEAGHAVVALRTGISVLWVELTIGDGSGADGQIRRGPFRAPLVNYLGVLWAGRQAQLLAARGRPRHAQEPA